MPWSMQLKESQVDECNEYKGYQRRDQVSFSDSEHANLAHRAPTFQQGSSTGRRTQQPRRRERYRLPPQASPELHCPSSSCRQRLPQGIEASRHLPSSRNPPAPFSRNTPRIHQNASALLDCPQRLVHRRKPPSNCRNQPSRSRKGRTRDPRDEQGPRRLPASPFVFQETSSSQEGLFGQFRGTADEESAEGVEGRIPLNQRSASLSSPPSPKVLPHRKVASPRAEPSSSRLLLLRPSRDTSSHASRADADERGRHGVAHGPSRCRDDGGQDAWSNRSGKPDDMRQGRQQGHLGAKLGSWRRGRICGGRAVPL